MLRNPLWRGFPLPGEKGNPEKVLRAKKKSLYIKGLQQNEKRNPGKGLQSISYIKGLQVVKIIYNR